MCFAHCVRVSFWQGQKRHFGVLFLVFGKKDGCFLLLGFEGCQGMEVDKFVNIMVMTPIDHADAVRSAMGEAGAGRLGNYQYGSFAVKGTGRFIPQNKAQPTIGKVGELESVEEELIEVLCEESILEKVVEAIEKVHPYEEIGITFFPVQVVRSKAKKKP